MKKKIVLAILLHSLLSKKKEEKEEEEEEEEEGRKEGIDGSPANLSHADTEFTFARYFHSILLYFLFRFNPVHRNSFQKRIPPRFIPLQQGSSAEIQFLPCSGPDIGGSPLPEVDINSTRRI